MVVSAFAPVFAYAQSGSLISDIIYKIVYIFNYLVIIIMALGSVVFLWGVISYITAAGDEVKLASAKNYITYGIITLFVMAAVWGLVAVLQNTFGIGAEFTPTPSY